MLEQVARAPRPEGFLVGDRRVGEPATQIGAQRIEVQEGEGERSEAAFHVARAAAVDAAVGDLAAPRAARPFVVGGGEDVHVPVQHQMAAGSGRIEARHDVGHDGLRRNDGRIEAGAAQGVEHDLRGRQGVAGRVGRGRAQQGLEEGHALRFARLQPIEQRLFDGRHHAPPR